MNVRNGLKVTSLLGKHIDLIAPYVFAIQKAKQNSVRIQLVGQVLYEILEKDPEGALRFVAHTLDIPMEEIADEDFQSAIDRIIKVVEETEWEKFVEAGAKLGIIKPESGIKLLMLRLRGKT